MTYYIFSESAGQNLVNERYCNIPSISNASFGHERSGSPSPNGLFSYFIFSLCKRGREFSWPSPWVVKEERTGPGNLKFVNPNTNQCPSPKICQKFGAFSEHYCQNVRFWSKNPIFGASENTLCTLCTKFV